MNVFHMNFAILFAAKNYCQRFLKKLSNKFGCQNTRPDKRKIIQRRENWSIFEWVRRICCDLYCWEFHETCSANALVNVSTRSHLLSAFVSVENLASPKSGATAYIKKVAFIIDLSVHMISLALTYLAAKKTVFTHFCWKQNEITTKRWGFTIVLLYMVRYLLSFIWNIANVNCGIQFGVCIVTNPVLKAGDVKIFVSFKSEDGVNHWIK